MTYQGIYDFYGYLEENKIDLPPTFKKGLLKSSLSKEDFFVVNFDEDIVREYLKYADSLLVRLFLENYIPNPSQEPLPNSELLRAIRTIGTLKEDLQVEMRKALSDRDICKDLDAINLICKQDTKLKMNEVRKATSIPAIRNNKELLNKIANQKSELEMFILRFYLTNDFIRENEYFVNLIANQDNAKKMSEMGRALVEEIIRKSDPIINLLNNQNTSEDMREIRLAYLNDFIREKLSFFCLIAEQKTAEDKRIIRNGILEGKIRNYAEGVSYLQEYKERIMEQNRVLEKLVSDPEQYREMFGLLADKFKGREYGSCSENQNLGR